MITIADLIRDAVATYGDDVFTVAGLGVGVGLIVSATRWLWDFMRDMLGDGPGAGGYASVEERSRDHY